MKPAPFDMVRPATIDEVLDVLSRHEDVKVLAGGQSLVPLMNLQHGHAVRAGGSEQKYRG